MAFTDLIGYQSNSNSANEEKNKLLKNLMHRIQQYVFRNRIRVKEFFKDFDPLNRGLITVSQFHRGLSAMGLERLKLTEAELNALSSHYMAELKPALICWHQMKNDVDSIFWQRGIEKTPQILTPVPDPIIQLPVPGTICLNDLPLTWKPAAERSLSYLRKRLLGDQCDLTHFFKGFDRHRNGHVSVQQFKQTLSMLNYYLCEEELDALAVLYSDRMGFNYERFVGDAKPITSKIRSLSQSNQLCRQIPSLDNPPRFKPEETDLNKIFQKLATRSKKFQPKLFNFLREHDRLNHGTINVIDFHRALDRAGFELTIKEVETLASAFKLSKKEDNVLWREFLKVLETFKAEKLPLEEDSCHESSKGQNAYFSGMKRLASKVHERRLEIRPMFRDFDVPQRGLVSYSQFKRVLDTAALTNPISPDELEAILQKFGVTHGSKKEGNYMDFCRVLAEFQNN